jgi:PAS domain S-box-containing protein
MWAPWLLVCLLFWIGMLEHAGLKSADWFARLGALARSNGDVILIQADAQDAKQFGAKAIRSGEITERLLEQIELSEPRAVVVMRGAIPDAAITERTNQSTSEAIGQRTARLVFEADIDSESSAKRPLFSAPRDTDRVVRRTLLAERSNTTPVPSLVLRAAEIALQDAAIIENTRIVLSGAVIAELATGEGEYVRNGTSLSALIPPYTRAPLEILSFADVLQTGKSVRGKVVVVAGLADPDALRYQLPQHSDWFGHGRLTHQALEFSDEATRGEVAAEQIRNLLSAAAGKTHALQGWNFFAVAAWTFVLMLLCAWALVPTSKLRQWLLIGGGGVAGLWLLGAVCFHWGVWIPVVAPTLGIILLSLIAITMVFRIEQNLRAFADVTQRALNRLPEPVFVKDSLGRIRLVNESFARLSGYLPNQLIGQNLSEVLPKWPILSLLEHSGDYETGRLSHDERAAPEHFVDAFGREYELNLLTARLPRPGRQDLIFALIRSCHATGDLHEARSSFELLDQRAQQLRFWAQHKQQHACVDWLQIEDFELLLEAYSSEQVEQLLRRVLERLRRAFASCFALERDMRDGTFCLLRIMPASSNDAGIESLTRHALDVAFGFEFEIEGETIELRVRCERRELLDADFASARQHALQSLARGSDD